MSNGLFSYTTVSKKNQSRIEEILDIFDYCAAPFGSEQWQYLNFGVKGWDWNPNKSGAPVLTKTGRSEQFPTGYICAPPYILYDSQHPEVTKVMHKFCDEAVPQGVCP
ncbi:MAG: hypothetical protein M1118_08525 [Chloroflexi bacterium]|nr:hypothetical protein [Chloroflexota bacterium]